MRVPMNLKASQQLYWSVFILLVLLPCFSYAADVQQNPPPTLSLQVSEPKANGVLTVDDAVQIALDNNPQIKAARERIASQQAVVGQQMAAYYPSVTSTERYQTGNQSGSTNVAATASDFVTGGAAVNMTLYNFGKREGTVQAAKETLSAV